METFDPMAVENLILMEMRMLSVLFDCSALEQATDEMDVFGCLFHLKADDYQQITGRDAREEYLG